jgi:hypothetical protein
MTGIISRLRVRQSITARKAVVETEPYRQWDEDYFDQHESAWLQRQKLIELRRLEALAHESIRARQLDAAKDDPDAPQAVKDWAEASALAPSKRPR